MKTKAERRKEVCNRKFIVKKKIPGSLKPQKSIFALVLIKDNYYNSHRLMEDKYPDSLFCVNEILEE